MAISPQPLLSVEAALEKLRGHFAPLKAVQTRLEAAAGEVLAAPIHSRLDLPPFPNSSMDGFALRAADASVAQSIAPARLAVVADIPAGKGWDGHLQPGQAARIMTGAPVPDGADAVIPVEDTDFNNRTPGLEAPPEVLIYRPVQPGENVRPRGQDVHAGDVVLQPGIRLRPQDVGMLAMLGVDQVFLHPRPRVAIFSSGDELLPAGAPLTPGKIYDANSYTLAAQVRQAGGVPLLLGVAADRADAVRELLDRALELRADLILSSAGVSVGAFDFVRQVIEQHGGLSFWRVNMRPGKPLVFGHYQAIPFFGLPGNPVSAFVGFEVFVRPALERMAGLAASDRPLRRVKLAESVDSDGRQSYLRAQIQQEGGEWIARLAGHQGSGNLRSLVLANALIVIPAEVKYLPAGAEVDAWLLGEVWA